ncbi:MAG: hypothetical protein ACTSP5_10030 [Candidatus Heimdallarchaeota archaeon]
MTRLEKRINTRITKDQRKTLEEHGNMSAVIRMLLDRLLIEERKPLVKEMIQEYEEMEVQATS